VTSLCGGHRLAIAWSGSWCHKVVRDVLEAQRTAIVDLGNRGEISNDVMHRVERELHRERELLEV